MQIGLTHYLFLSAILFCLGIAVLVARRNAIAILVGLELMLNAAGINFVAFSRYVTGNVEGQVVTIFIIILAAAEVAIALGIVLNVYNHLSSANVDEADSLRN